MLHRLVQCLLAAAGNEDVGVLWGGRGEDEGIGWATAAGQPVVQGRRVGDIVGLVDHHRIPVVAAKIAGETILLNVSIEMITRLK